MSCSTVYNSVYINCEIVTWKMKKGLYYFVTPARLERATHSLEGCCSIHLSYGAKIFMDS